MGVQCPYRLLKEEPDLKKTSHLLRPAAIGRGDVLLLAACGLGAGFPGIIYVLTRGLGAMAVVSVVQLLRRKVTIRSELPLAPFLLFGALI